MEKLPFSLAEMIHKSPFAVCKDHLLFGTKKSKYLALSTIDGSVITLLEGKVPFEGIKITKPHLWLAVNQYSAVVYLQRKGSIVPVWNVDYVEVLEGPFAFEASFKAKTRISYSTDGNLVIQSLLDADELNFGLKFATPCYKTFQLIESENETFLVRLEPSKITEEIYNFIHLVTIPNSEFPFALPSMHYIQVAGKLSAQQMQEPSSLVLYSNDGISNTISYFEPLAIGNDSLELQKHKNSPQTTYLAIGNYQKQYYAGNFATIIFSIILAFLVGYLVFAKKTTSNLLQVSDEILGYGSNGTVVFKITFNGNIVAVKRILNEYIEVAKHEVDLLHQTDPHPNVIRYYYMERKKEFTYIVLEYCLCSLHDLFFNDSFAFLSSQLSADQMIEQLLEGIGHLHRLNIIQNILITDNNRVVISDFGLCKRLANIQQSFLPTMNLNSAIGGSIGWRPAECILLQELLHSSSRLNIKMNRSIDVFSVGCIIYFILSRGKHPFGEPFERESNILASNYTLDEANIEYQDLLQRMLCKQASERISIQRARRHIVFWSPNKRLTFIQDISDRLEIHDFKYSDLYKQVEMQLTNLVPTPKKDWSLQFNAEILADLFSFLTYNQCALKDLLRFIRNKKNHYHQMDERLRKAYGQIPNEFLAFFTSKFPKLLICLYVAVNKAKGCLDQTFFDAYLAPKEV